MAISKVITSLSRHNKGRFDVFMSLLAPRLQAGVPPTSITGGYEPTSLFMIAWDHVG